MRLGYGDAGNSGADRHLPLIARSFASADRHRFLNPKPLDYNSGPGENHD